MVVNHSCGASTKPAVIGNAIDPDFAKKTGQMVVGTRTHLL